MTADVDHADVQELSYEQARDELTSVVGSLESGGIPLARSLALWQRAQLLADHCQVILDAARATVEESAILADASSDAPSGGAPGPAADDAPSPTPDRGSRNPSPGEHGGSQEG